MKRQVIKGLLISLAVLILLGALVWFVVIPLYAQGDDGAHQAIHIYGYTEGPNQYTLENDKLRFTLDPKTTNFSVLMKDTGRVWYSSAQDALNDPIALTADKNRLQSALTLTYSTSSNVITLLDSYGFSVQNGVYTVEQEGDTVVVNYSMGKISRTYMIPAVTTQERFEHFLSLMSSSAARRTKEYYTLYDLNKLKKNMNAEDLLAKYPLLMNGPIYVLREGTKEHLLATTEKNFAAAGYTQEDFTYDQSLANVESVTNKPVFDITLRYSLSDADLVVEVPFDRISYNPAYPITKINLLPNFGAASDKESGFLFVPEGGGAMIDFNNGRLKQNAYFANVYGWDSATVRKAVISETRTAFPVFGVGAGGNSFLCMMEDGASLGGIGADIAGRYTSYNSVSATYTVLHGDPYDVSAKTTAQVYMFEKELPTGSIVQRYRFLKTDNYAAMARAYGDYLLTRYPALKKRTVQPALLIEIIGAADKVVQYMGLPVSRPLPLTTFDQAAGIVNDLSAAGLNGLNVKLTGWMNGGVKQKVLSSVSPLNELGGTAGLYNLLRGLKDSDIPVYLDAVTQYAMNSGIWDGFISFRDAAKFTTREHAILRPYSNIWYGVFVGEEPYYLLKPAVIQTMMKNASAYAKEQGAGISFEDAGYLLSADYNPRDRVTREQALEKQAAALSDIAGAGQNIMVKTGNLYALPYASMITDMAMHGNNYSIFDRQIPFYQIALHGHVGYVTEPLNLSADMTQTLLNAAEYGANLQFSFMNAPVSVLQDTDYYCYFGANYAAWRNQAIELAMDYQQRMGGLSSQLIVDHAYLAPAVTVTAYGNGSKVYVNYGNSSFSTGDITIDARSFIVDGGDGV